MFDSFYFSMLRSVRFFSARRCWRLCFDLSQVEAILFHNTFFRFQTYIRSSFSMPVPHTKPFHVDHHAFSALSQQDSHISHRTNTQPCDCFPQCFTSDHPTLLPAYAEVLESHCASTNQSSVYDLSPSSNERGFAMANADPAVQSSPSMPQESVICLQHVSVPVRS